MNRRLALLVVLVLAAVGTTPVLACLWDYDTLAVERSRFPSILELITGKFLRHSDEFYRWRIEDRRQRLEQDAGNLRLYDDLAVAYDKTGQHALAIETMQGVLEQDPDRYETLANLGTFHIHEGDLETGLAFIKRAIEVNPDAHFGRERSQQLLVEYVLSRQVDGAAPLPLNGGRGSATPGGFAAFVLAARQEPDDDPTSNERKADELKKALTGVAGMMRFGKRDSPVLLEALGDLLLAAGYPEDAKRLAARAYLRASYAVEDSEVQAAYREMAQDALSFQTPQPRTPTQLKLNSLESDFRTELADAERWFASVRQDEARWIAAGADVDAEFSRKYYDEPHVDSPAASPLGGALPVFAARLSLLTLGGVAIVVLAILTAVSLLAYLLLRRPARPA